MKCGECRAFKTPLCLIRTSEEANYYVVVYADDTCPFDYWVQQRDALNEKESGDEQVPK